MEKDKKKRRNKKKNKKRTGKEEEGLYLKIRTAQWHLINLKFKAYKFLSQILGLYM